jgi:hypothetical protein
MYNMMVRMRKDYVLCRRQRETCIILYDGEEEEGLSPAQEPG